MAKTNKTAQIINALFNNPTVKEASKASGISEATIYNYLKKDDFQARYNQAKKELVSNTTSFLQARLSEATNTVLNIMRDELTAPQVKLNACKAVFDYCIKLTEQTEILERLEALEQAQEKE